MDNTTVTVTKRVLILTVTLLPMLGTIFIDNWRWQGVPFHFMTGKKMPYTSAEVVIKLKASTTTLV